VRVFYFLMIGDFRM